MTLSCQEKLRGIAGYLPSSPAEDLEDAAARLDQLENMLREAFKVVYGPHNYTADERLMLAADIDLVLGGNKGET